MSSPNSKKQKKNRDKRKKYERKRNILKQIRRKYRGKPDFKYIRAEKVYCDECSHCRMNPKKADTYYCGLTDQERLDNDLLKGWGFFENNKDGNCTYFKKAKKGFLKRLLKL